jgi:beta-mannosidase
MLRRRLFVLSLIPIAASLCPAEVQRSRRVLAEGWLIRQLDAQPDIARLAREFEAPGREWLRARMPAQVHDILLEHGLIPDPRLSDNAAKVRWVAEKDWVYACRFESPAATGGPVFLEFQGLDTLATAYLNGREIGSFDNMFRQYRVEVAKQLAAPGAANVLLIVFRSPLRYLAEFEQPAAHVGKIPKTRYLRKAPPDFSSYLGARPDLIKVGVFRDIVLDAPGAQWIEDVRVRTELAPDRKRAVLRVLPETSGAGATLAYCLFDPDGKEVARGKPQSAREFGIEVANPRLWWPRMYGAQPLYKLAVTLERGGATVDSRDIRVGIREVKPVLVDAATGEKRFRFDVNGMPVYFRGGCWAPIEHLSHCWQPDRARRLLDLAENGRMNIFRIWGEGSEPPPEFYDECDRRGIMIWQDFFFANGMEPVDVPEFAANCRTEMDGLVRRLRNHPSLLLWCGGNENYMSVDFARREFTIGNELFLKTMPDLVARLDPGRFYHPSSPYGGKPPNWPLEGDWHDYTTIQFAPEASVPLWTSEVLRASPPTLASMRRFLKEDELWPAGWSTQVRKPGAPAWPPAWTYHSTGVATWDRVGAIESYVDAASPGELIRNLGTAHSEYLQERLERQRRGVPDGAAPGSRRSWGNTLWRFNDPWPMIYSSVVDYYLEPKIAYYGTRRAYDPVLVSFERTPDWIAVWVTNDSPESVAGPLVVRHRRFDGKTLAEKRAPVSLAPAESRRILKLTGFGILSLRDEFLEADFGARKATLLLIAERYLHLPQARLSVRRSGDAVEIESPVFARQVTLELEGATGASFDDNYFDMAPGESRKIRILNDGGGRRLSVRALNADAIEAQ